MKIGIDARFVGPEGTGLGKYTEKLIGNLAQLDSKNQYIIFLRQNNWSFLKIDKKNFHKMLADVSWYSIDEQIKMPGIYKSANLDILHVPHFNVPILYKAPFIVTIHDLIHHKFKEESATTKNPIIFRAKRYAYKRIIKNAVITSKKIITPSSYVKDEIIKNFKVDPSKIVVTYEAAEEEYFQKPGLSKSKDQQKLLYVGNTYPHKNIANLLDAMSLLPGEVTLTLVCPRDVFASRLEKEIESRNLGSRVEIKPYQDVKSLTKIFQNSSVYVFPSLEEGFGIPGLNAMAAGLPVVASNIPTLKEVYSDAALYFDPTNPKDIAAKIKGVLTNPKTKNEMAEKGRKQAAKYSWQTMAKQTLQIYENSSGS